MYYNSNQNSNEYYSSYKQELTVTDTNKGNKGSLLIKKVGMGILLLALLAGSLYLIKNSTTKKKEILTPNLTDSNHEIKPTNVLVENSTDAVPKIIISDENLPKSIQLQDSESKIISNLKQNATDSLTANSPLKSKEHNAIKKEVIALTETSNLNSDDIEKIVNLIIEMKKEKSKSSLEEELLNAELAESTNKTLKESNHYNKVTLSSKDENSTNKLMLLSDELTKSNKKVKLSKYENALKHEIATRSNEMRIIIVKKGDSLSKLALKAYGDKLSYDKIFKANPEIIKNPNQIFIGQKIRIPL